MKKELAAACLATLVASASAFALTYNGTNNAGDGLVKSKHNMLNYTEMASTDDQGRVCAFCHTPHHAIGDTSVDYLPLWSHKLLTTDQRNYTAYASPSFDISGITVDPLAGATLLCMSCHDGNIAVDEHYSNGLDANKLTNDAFGSTEVTGGGSGIGKGSTLANDHPVGFSYKAYLDKRPYDLNPLATKFAGTKTDKTIESQLGANYLFTCASCHDVHNKDSVPNSKGAGTRNFFLLGDNNGSAFCLSCHNK